MCVTVLSVLGLVYAAGCGARLPTATVVIYAPPSLRLGECRRRFGRRHSTSREHDTNTQNPPYGAIRLVYVSTWSAVL